MTKTSAKAEKQHAELRELVAGGAGVKAVIAFVTKAKPPMLVANLVSTAAFNEAMTPAIRDALFA